MSDPTLREQVARQLVTGISPAVLPESAGEAELSEARKLCREGNPFPLIAIQWPHLIINDPKESAFFRGTIGDKLDPCLRLDWWQRMIALAFFDDSIREVYIKGCTGAGKGGIVAMCCCLLYDVHDVLRLSFTGPKFEHTFKGIFAETDDWYKQMRNPRPRSDASTTIASDPRHYIDIQNPQRGKAGEDFSGQHSREPMGRWVIFDEATSAEDTWIENAEKNAYKVVCIANPRTVSGSFRNAFKPLGPDKENKNGICMGKLGKRLCVTIGGADCANVKYGRIKTPIAPPTGITIGSTTYAPGERISPDDYEQVKPLIPGQMDLTQFHAACSSPEKWKVRCFAHGMFPDEDPESQIILGSWLPRHNAFWHQSMDGFDVPVTAFGLDVARSLDGDDSCLSAGSSLGCREQIRKKLDNYTLIANWVLEEVLTRYDIDLKMGQNPVCIDYGGGYGAGVGDWLEMAGVWVIKSHPSGRAEVMPEVYSNMRAEMYGLLGRRLNPADPCGLEPWAVPEDSVLHEELAAATRKWNADMTRFLVVGKEEMKQNLNRSPDRGDSLALLFQAVRLLDGLDDWFRMTSDDLLVYPRPESSGVKPPASPRNPQQQIQDLIEWGLSKAKGSGPTQRRWGLDDDG